ncbi:MAG: hypothetical protein QW254_01930 [Desulfurococcaceae archaeon]
MSSECQLCVKLGNIAEENLLEEVRVKGEVARKGRNMSEDELKGKVSDTTLSKYNEIKSLKPTRQGGFIGANEDKFYIALSEEDVYELSPLTYYV